MCIVFSLIQAINKVRRDHKIIERELIAGRLRLQWPCFLYRKQLARGTHVLHGNPAGVASRTEPCVLQVLAMKASGASDLISACTVRSPSLAAPLSSRPDACPTPIACLRYSTAPALGGKALFAPLGQQAPEFPQKTVRRAAILSDQMCETILRGISFRLKSDRRTRTLEHGICHVDATVLDGNDDV